MFCSTDFFSNWLIWIWFEKKLVGQKMNMWIYTSSSNERSSYVPVFLLYLKSQIVKEMSHNFLNFCIDKNDKNFCADKMLACYIPLVPNL